MKKVKVIIKALLCILELLALYIFICALMFEEEKIMAASFSVTSFIMMIVSGFTVYHIIKGKKKAFIKSVLLNTVIFFSGYGIACLDPHLEDGIYASGLFWVLAAVFLVCFIMCFRHKKTVSEKKQSGLHTFEPYKAKYVWDKAAEEYIDRFGLDSVDNLNDEQREKIYEYASMPVIYLLEWLFRNGFVSHDLSKYTEQIKNEQISVSEVFRNMDYVLSKNNIQPEIVPFLNGYFEDVDIKRIYGLESKCFFFDYYEVIDNPEGYFYCVDYSHEDYEKTAALISGRFNEYRNSLNEFLYIEKYTEVEWKRFRTFLSVRKYNDKSTPYKGDIISEIDEALNSLSDETVLEMFRAFGSSWNIDEMSEDASAEISSEEYCCRIANMIRFEEIVIFPEYIANEPGFAVTGSADFEEEHGISATFRGGELVSTAYQMDYIDPYSAEADKILQLKANNRILNNYNLNSTDVLSDLAATGSILVKTIIDGDTVYMCKSALKDLNESEIRLRALRAIGVLDKVEYKKKYDSLSSIVPKSIIIRGLSGDKVVFSEMARNW